MKASKELQEFWAQKLADSGFEDLEVHSNKDYALQSQIFNVYSIFKLEASYVKMMSKLFEPEHKTSSRNLFILRLHLDGFSQRKLLVHLNLAYTPISQQAVHKALNKMQQKAREL